MVAIKVLHAVAISVPGINWWWRIIKAPVKAMKLEGVGNPLSDCSLSRLVRKHRIKTDRKVQDVEMAPVPS